MTEITVEGCIIPLTYELLWLSLAVVLLVITYKLIVFYDEEGIL